MQVRCAPDEAGSGVTLVTVAGRIDALGATELWEAASPHITSDRPRLLVDFSGVDMLTSAGITTLVQFMNRVRPLGGTLSVFGCRPTVRQVFRIVGMESLMNVCDTMGEARQRIGA